MGEPCTEERDLAGISATILRPFSPLPPLFRRRGSERVVSASVYNGDGTRERRWRRTIILISTQHAPHPTTVLYSVLLQPLLLPPSRPAPLLLSSLSCSTSRNGDALTLSPPRPSTRRGRGRKRERATSAGLHIVYSIVVTPALSPAASHRVVSQRCLAVTRRCMMESLDLSCVTFPFSTLLMHRTCGKGRSH